MQLVYHVTTQRNFVRIRTEGLFPRIGSNARAAGERRPAIYCFRNREDLDNALDNWLGERLQEPLVILTLNIESLNHEANPHEFETRVLEPVGANRIFAAEDEYGRELQTHYSLRAA
jgi:hypothetical protein